MYVIRAKRSTLNLLSIAIGVLFTCAIFYTMHYRIPWDWDAPGIGKLPREVVSEFLEEAYGNGDGATAVRSYFAPDIVVDATAPQEREDADPVPHEIKSIVTQGLTVVVFHRIGSARGEPAADVIELFEVRDGRIVRRERYPTSFASSIGA